jgi:hypothetical protein
MELKDYIGGMASNQHIIHSVWFPLVQKLLQDTHGYNDPMHLSETLPYSQHNKYRVIPRL